jgi:hypothetical protein
MSTPKPNWASSPWIGEGAAAQWSLWRAGVEWAAKVHGLSGDDNRIEGLKKLRTMLEK